MTTHELQQEILRLKKEKNVCILAHAYQSQAVLEVADYTGDSYGLSVQAAKTDAAGVIMCGVRFMAETCKILSPEKTVWLANPMAGCPMAEQLDLLAPSAHLVGTGGAVATLSDEEVAFVRDFGGARHVVEMSRGAIVDGRLVVSEGPLAGREHLVAKIDRHKRIAFLDIRTGAALGGGGAVRVGLEVVSKS